ncbi:unnamed protein product [Cuscuta campestris]|uniref:Uncharacterized protein n=1 Tax=Cuscuta campestris TaxID=132261 RepID=A0A484M550_9ASTE|nr:unnamed protein product [Cuscuta campestris]VFQ83971.1 unnamed protein product [Cuscuta campestris]
MEVQPPAQAPPPCWSNIVKQEPPPLQQNNLFPFSAPSRPPNPELVGNCSSTKGIAVAVVDANAIIRGGQNLSHQADRFVSVPEVLTEIRDPTSRHSLNFLPFTVDTMEPLPDALKKVIRFARATGDLQTLSDVDLKLLALTYTLEAQSHGTEHLRDCPPPIHTVNVRRLPEKDLPGWGTNVSNLEEWEALENAVESNATSRILPLKDLTLNAVPTDQPSTDGSLTSINVGGFRKPRKYLAQKKEIKIEGKKMVADGIDASQGQFDEDNASDWLPAVSRSTHRKYLRRKARRDLRHTPSEREDVDGASTEIIEENVSEEISNILNEMRLEEDKSSDSDDVKSSDADINNNTNKDAGDIEEEDVGAGDFDKGVKAVEIASQSCESTGMSQVDDCSSEQSWTLRSLSESTVACITSDFAMQNVILQMGLRLIAPGGMQIRELQRWVLKCHACYKVTTEIGRIFCPCCGNGGTLRKVAVTVGENGIVIAARKPRVSLRGTKFSLPLPQGGRNGIAKNPVLREDQLEQKFLHPKTKKKNKKGDDDIFTQDNIFVNHTDKKAPLQPPMRQTVAVFYGRRNPNDNHYSRALH